MNIVQKYTKEQAEKFSQMLALIVLALEERYMGHSSFEVTMNTYAHLMPEVYEKSKQAIDELLLFVC